MEVREKLPEACYTTSFRMKMSAYVLLRLALVELQF